MHAYLIQGQGKEAIEKKVKEILNNLSLKSKPILKEFEIKKIEDARSFRKILKLAGSIHRQTVYLIQNFDEVTNDSYHTLLKTIEEPPTNTVFIFTCKNIHNIPETLTSRMLIYRTSQQLKDLKEKENRITLNITEVDKYSNREDAITLLDKLIGSNHRSFHRETSEKEIKKIARNLSILFTTREALAGGGNVKLQLTTLVLKLVS